MESTGHSPRSPLATRSGGRLHHRYLSLLLTFVTSLAVFSYASCAHLGWLRARPNARRLLSNPVAAGPLPLATRLEGLHPSPSDLAVTASDRVACAGVPSVAQPLFRLHILDASKLLPGMNISATSTVCDPESTAIWPHRLLWRGAQATVSMPHWAYQHAGGWWAARAAARSAAVLMVDSADEADLVLLDVHCLNSRLYSWLLPNGIKEQDVSTFIDKDTVAVLP